MDIHVLKRLNGIPSTPFDAVSLTATRFALLISKVFGMPFSGTGAENTPDYVKWLVTRVLEGPLRNEPGLARETAGILKRMFLDVAPKAIRTKRARTLMVLLHQYLDLLPDPIREELNRDPEFASRLKFRSTLVVEIAGYRFERSAFLAAATEAINGRERTISDLPGKAVFLLKGCLESKSACGFLLEKQGNTKETFEVRDALFGVLKESPSARDEHLRRERHLFDMPGASSRISLLM